MMRFYIPLLMAFLFLFSCEEEEGQTDLTNPSNLDVEVTIADDLSGRVDVLATGDNVTQYQYYMGEDPDSYEFSLDGKLTYTYTAFGIYEIEVRAYGESGRYISKTQEVNIQIGEEGGPIDLEDGYSTPTSYEGMDLVWHDEFNGTSLNSSDWSYETGTGSNGWGNNELQYYRQENTTVGEGVLTITAKKESFQGREYTSSRLVTAKKQEFTYGRVDIRALLPKGQGLWPALWMLGANYQTVTWPACGEIDIMELVGGTDRDDEVHGTVHWEHGGNYASYGKGTKLSSGVFADEYHVFSIVWDESKITWYVDDKQFNVIDTTSDELSEFHHDYFFIMNIAVGGNWPGSPNASTVFPQTMKVDYIRMFQKSE
ncbi:glycoside hydrolase [Reichenbachiella sp. 5M10]|uniref:glycoside hydrolase family 16 protein n=1 Tax=Reichenbachiella sp. 5M10 TaxID=1889772 RepID=UPI000C516253|nr:glycoside hydrolase family 16 protein [Reichenbachiella sp. 5M10]PIB36242.1 glycoside hydrolase [Reichenbachiella sp. 5M10]